MKTAIKVEINENKPDEMISLSEKVLVKHKELGADSPLNAIDIVMFEQNLTLGKANRTEAKRLHDEAEKLNQQAALNLGIGKSQSVNTPGTVYSTLTRVRDILLGIHKGQEKNLNDWGFNVVISEVAKSNKANTTTK